MRAFVDRHARCLRRDFQATSIQLEDVGHFWTQELDKSVKRIHHDFEVFYATIYREMMTYYETKMDEVKKEVEEALHDQQFDDDEFAITQQALHVENEKAQHTLVYEREVAMKLEARFGR